MSDLTVKIWAVVSNNGDGSSSCGIFITEEAARKYMDEYNAESYDYELGEDEISWFDLRIEDGKLTEIK